MSDENLEKSPSVSDDQPITGLVADILNEREVVLNIGRNHGVTRKMRFAILGEVDYIIKDPKTGEVLDQLPPREKVRVEVVELTDKIAVARTYEVIKENVGGVGIPRMDFGALYQPPRIIEKPVTFRIGETGKTYYDFKQVSPEESIVQIGDTVRQIL